MGSKEYTKYECPCDDDDARDFTKRANRTLKEGDKETAEMQFQWAINRCETVRILRHGGRVRHV